MTDKQATLFPRWNADQLTPTDPNVAEEDKPRLSGQNLAMLEYLRHGPCMTDELAMISRKYTSRISDLRKAGFVIECSRRPGGNNVYTLKE